MSEESERVFLTQKMVNGQGDFAFTIGYENHPFDIPKNLPYGEFYIVTNPNSIPISGEGTGKVRVRYVGFVQLNVWIPNNSGTKPATLAGDLFKKLFSFKIGRDTSGNTYKFKTLQKLNAPDQNGWTCRIFRVPYERDAIEDVQISEF